MEKIAVISAYIIPAVMVIVVVHGFYKKINIYDEFIEGAKTGIKTVVSIVPTLIGLMMAVGILRTSGFLDFIGNITGKFTEKIGLPAPLVPMILVRLFSSSAATGLTLDLFEQFGPDSYIGKAASIIASATETVFFTISIYAVAAKISKVRWTVSGALVSTLAGVIASLLVTHIF